MADPKNLKGKLFAGCSLRGPAAANPDQATYEFGSELAGDASVAAFKNVTYGESGQQLTGNRRGKTGR
ncbi:MAG TPA: hypothetical protein VNT75_04770 [Symbiobacteriaceae bacterium]|nr:hypothetical protein [Symbiobacteriaceae bacterium]